LILNAGTVVSLELPVTNTAIEFETNLQKRSPTCIVTTSFK